MKITGSAEECLSYKLPGRSLLLDIRLIQISGSDLPLIACGTDNGKINIMTATDPSNYTLAISLPGHEDWVTSLDFITYCKFILI